MIQFVFIFINPPSFVPVKLMCVKCSSSCLFYFALEHCIVYILDIWDISSFWLFLIKLLWASLDEALLHNLTKVLLVTCLGVELLGCRLHFFGLRRAVQFSQLLSQFTSLPTVHKSSGCSTFLEMFGIVRTSCFIFHFRNSCGHAVAFHCGFNSHFADSY